MLSCATVCAISAAHAQSGTWTGVASPALWSNTANWTGGIVASGSGNTAHFETIDLPDGPFQLSLDTPRTLSNLSFGDINTTTAGSWLVDNNLDPLNVLTLDGTPVLTVNAMATGAAAEISAVVAGSAGVSKAGTGALTLSGANTYSGTTAVNAGTLNINSATAIGTSTLTLAGGNIGSTGAAVTLNNNNAQNWNSNFTFAGPSNLAMGTGAINVPGAITLTATAGQLNLGGVITSTGTFTKDGAGEVLLSGANVASFTGPMTLKGGLVRIRGNMATGATGVALNQEPIGSLTKTITFEGGALMLNGATGSNGPTTVAFTNPVVVAAGQTGTVWGPQRGAFNSTLTGSGTFNFIGNYVRGDLNGNWTGFTGTVNASGANTAGNSDVRIAGANILHAGLALNITNASVYQTYNPPNNAVGTTQIIGRLSGSAAAFLGGSPVGGRFVNWQVGALNQDTEYAGVIGNSAGAARLYKVGTGTLTLSGANTYTGDTQLNAGKISVGNGGASGSLAATNVITVAGTQLIFNRGSSASSVYPGILSGPGTITKRGAGQVNFTGANTYTAGTTIEGGIIGINSPASLGSAGAVSFTTANGGVISILPGVVESRSFNVASGLTASFGGATAGDSLEVTSSITGAGSLAVSGDGFLTLSGANAYAGPTTVSSGALVAANLSGSATSSGAVSFSAGTLAGEGTIAGAVTTASGVSLKPGALTPTSSGVGNLTVGSLALAGGTTLYTEFTNSATYDKITVSNPNGLTVSASLANPVMVDLRVANSTAKWTTPGTYTILQFAGSFVGNANDLFEVTPASQQAGQTYTFSVVGNSIQLVVAGNLPSIWNVDASGNWSAAGNWANGSPNAIGATAQFDSKITGTQTVTLDSSRTVGLIQFNNANSYAIDGTATLTLNQAVGNAQVDVLLGAHSISTPIQLADPIGIDLFNGANSLTLSGNIGGAGGITKSGPGNLALAGSNNFLGNLSFANGTLTFGNKSLGSGALTLNNASLVWGPGNNQDITIGRAITFGNDPITFSMDSDVILSNDFGLSGTANLTKDGTGKLTLVADTSFLGNLTVLNGNLTLGDGGATGSVLGAIALNNASSILTVSHSGDPVINNLISGTGSLVLDGNGLQSLMQPNTFSGTTTINGGTAVLGSGLALQNSSLLYNAAGGALDFGANSAATLGSLGGDKDLVLENGSASAVILTAGGNGAATAYTGVLSGAGSFTKAGAGIMTFTGAHTYSGATQVNGGALELDSTVTLNNTTVSVGATGRLTSNGATINASVASNVAAGATGAAIFEVFGGTANFPGGLNGVGNATNVYRIQVSGGSLSAGGMSIGRSGLVYTTEPAAGSVNDGLYVNGGDVDIVGSLLLGNTSGANSSVSTRIDSGSLDITGPISIGLNNGGRWSVVDVGGGVFSSADTGTGVRLGGPLQGNAAFLTRGGVATVERFQFGNLALGGTGTVAVSGGELYVGSGGMVMGTTEPGYVATLRLSGGVIGAKAAWSTALPVATSNVFEVKAADASSVAHDITLSGAVSGTGSLVKSGAGTLTLSGTYNYTGNTNVTAGTLVLGTATLSDAATVDVATGAVINLPHGQVDTVQDFLINGVSQGPGTYTSANSGGRITGTGSLRVAAADPYIAWIGSFSVGALTGKADDADGDGLTNLEEFALDGNPASGASTGKVRSRIETVGADQALVITLPVRSGATFSGTPSKSATIDDLIYTVRGGNNFAAFDQGITEIAVSSTGMPVLSTGWTYRTFRLDGAIGGATPRGPKGFIDIDTVDAP
ncbi:autotransporter-associated beta strand repeat-containing protein [Haloferula sp. BvORR071]|uniref:beta strand repeat-containing protein n=1 Tax=Haloferula sp. BvORR071 TaxID=1396141 RepID=UPI002240EDE1|nr:autotransporter-associated beta strand repeat-containing protein [Haloferula sp. BvORR071]